MATNKEALRGLSETFMVELKKGRLHTILERIQKDDTLMLAIRENYINIYYRGGNILKITEKAGVYETYFDKNYDESELLVKHLPNPIASRGDAELWVDNISILKQTMDFYFAKHQKPEREFQQLIARENNFSTVSNESEYFITDIEFADSTNKSRFDMLAIQWPATGRKDGSNCKAALIEVKYGDGALGGKAGLEKHLSDIEKLTTDTQKYEDLLQTMEVQIEQLQKLDLLKCNGLVAEKTKVKLARNIKPEVIFILANHNPRSTKLETFLNALEVKPKTPQKFDLKFFVASSSGYAMHSGCMLDLEKFQKFLALLK